MLLHDLHCPETHHQTKWRFGGMVQFEHTQVHRVRAYKIQNIKLDIDHPCQVVLFDCRTTLLYLLYGRFGRFGRRRFGLLVVANHGHLLGGRGLIDSLYPF